MTVAIIPARGGSKRIPRKNIRPFNGKPMIAWPITVAKASGLFSRVIVSTDDQEIADIACAAGAEVPFMRPPALADDHTGTSAVVHHALSVLAQRDELPANCCCIYATTPLLQADDLARAEALLQQEPSVQFVFSACRFSFPVQRALQQLAGGGVAALQPECIGMRSQDLTPAFHDAGQFYFGRSQAFLAGLEVFAEHSRMLELPSYRVQDIDTEDDWRRAELLQQLLERQ